MVSKKQHNRKGIEKMKTDDLIALQFGEHAKRTIGKMKDKQIYPLASGHKHKPGKNMDVAPIKL